MAQKSWIRDSGLPEVPGVPWGPFLDMFLFIVEPVRLILPYSALRGFSLLLGPLSDSTTSYGDESVIRSAPLLACFSVTACFFVFFLLLLLASDSHQLCPLHSVLCTQLELCSSHSKPQSPNSALRAPHLQMLSVTLPILVTTTTTSKNAAKKRRQRKNRAAANSAAPATNADTNPPTVNTPNASDTTTPATDNSKYPDKATKDLWRLVARQAAKQAWQKKYAGKQRQLMAASTPPNWDQWGDVHQTAVNFYYKQLYSTAPITVNAIFEPTAATDIPPPAQTDPRTVPAWIANDDCDTVTKVEAKLLRMQEYWAESQTGPFLESVRNAIANLQASFEKRDRETTANPSPASTTTTATIPAPTNTATPAIYETTTTTTATSTMERSGRPQQGGESM